MSSPFDDFRESLADATITGVEKSGDKDVVVKLVLWNEDNAELRFSEVISFDEPTEKGIEYLSESREGEALSSALRSKFDSVPEGHEYALFSLTNMDEAPVCSIVAKSVAFQVIS